MLHNYLYLFLIIYVSIDLIVTEAVTKYVYFTLISFNWQIVLIL